MSSLQASYIVIHNGSGEILDASVDLTLGTLSSQQAIVLQTFKVRFVMVGLSASLTLFPSLPYSMNICTACNNMLGRAWKQGYNFLLCCFSKTNATTILSIRLVHTKQN